jgi:UDP-4-amino-4,6-dideoxy-N-acetyl-beta-L-altrosamine transaminase
MINYGKHFIDKDDIKSVLSVLKSDFLTQGPKVEEFEKKLKSLFKAKYACCTSSGTAALHLCGLALNWKKKHLILASPLTFVATTNAALYLGAKVDFVDIDKETYNIDINKLENKLIALKKHKKKVHTLIVTDYAGQPSDWPKLKSLSKKFRFKLINDNCHSIGSKIFNDSGYAVKYADLVCHSYHPVKNITTGEGGSVLTNNKSLYDKIKILRSHGIIKNKKEPWKYLINELGYNYRLSDIQSALGISQLKKLKMFIKKKKEIAKIYDKRFKDFDLFEIPKVKKNISHSYHLYPLKIKFEKLNITKDFLLKKLRSIGINLQVHYIPVYHHSLYKIRNKSEFTNTENFFNQVVSLPIYYSLSKSQINFIINSILKIVIAKLKKNSFKRKNS